MADVSALVLSIGEPYTDRALASVRDQTLAVAETIIARDELPFHAAFNNGAARVRTSFFLQVDADMILDARCVEFLRAAMAPTVGLVVGRLLDPILGRIIGVKLFRTACVLETPFPGSVSPDTDAVGTLRARGWSAAYALCWDSGHTFGRHEPDYTVPYTYAKFLVTGARHQYRRNGKATRGLFRRLCRSEHPLAPVAVAALAHGLFLEASGDLLGGGRRWPVPRVLADFDTAHPRRPLDRGVQLPPAGKEPSMKALEDCFVRGYLYGRATADASAEGVRSEYARLGAEWSLLSWVSAVGFFHGLLCEDGDRSDVERAFARLAPLLPDADRVVE